MFKPRWYVLLLLVAFAVLVKVFSYTWMRFNPELDPRYSMFLPWNFAPLMAFTLFAGAYFRNPVWGPLLPLLALVIGDIGVYLISGRADWGMHLIQPHVYLTMVLCGLLSLALRKRDQFFAKGTTVLGLGLAAETLFFLATNAAVWRMSYLNPDAGYTVYGQSFSGLMECYAAGLPFYLRSLASTAVYGTALFYGYKVYATAANPELRSHTAQPVEAT